MDFIGKIENGTENNDFKGCFKVMKDLLDNSELGMVLLGRDFKVIDSNEQFAKMLGYSKEEILNLHVWDWDPYTSKEAMERLSIETEKLNLTFESQHLTKDGNIIDVFLSIDTGMMNDELVSFCISVDMTEKRRLQRELKKSESMFKNFVENSQDVIFVINRNYTITYFSPNVEKFYQVPQSIFIGQNYLSFLLPEYRLRLERVFKEIFEGEKIHGSAEYQVMGIDEKNHWIESNISLSVDEFGEPVIIGISRNIQKQKDYEKKLEYLSFHDQLTGLYNRAYFDDAIKRFKNGRYYPITVFAVDIDDLKIINDNFGHHTGDQLIKRCACLLKKMFRKEDIIARIGGDEFVAILPKTNEAVAKAISDRIACELETFNEDYRHKLKFSYGFVTEENEKIPLFDIYKRSDHMLINKKKIKKS
ncbi:sensor domain-containing diguanylate cyclase [Alkalibacter mobilis]|uniref:sensor domain-containing diguanylate cyclase n=1 Tax=Alkalibacter mobilis TaxID=2787712 RepID=UPI00189DF1E6|nr:sensor domain-containing diguanylate cyclase [Alkalibacter mobilis]MBF7097450.1 diguanylate cyclase [Alkalibacter mobilis]